LMTIGAVLLQGTSYGRQSNSASQQTPSQSRETTHSSEGQKDGQVRGETNQTGAGDSDVAENSPERRTRHVTQRRPKQSHARPAAPHHQVRSGRTPVASSLRPETLENGMGFHQMGSTTSNGIPNKTINHHGSPVPSPTGAINGQQFKSPRDPGARLASSEGPLTATRGTAVINGTNMKRKP